MVWLSNVLYYNEQQYGTIMDKKKRSYVVNSRKQLKFPQMSAKTVVQVYRARLIGIQLRAPESGERGRAPFKTLCQWGGGSFHLFVHMFNVRKTFLSVVGARE